MALQEPSWVEAMNEELNQFEKLKVWRFVEFPVGKKALDTRWVFCNKQNDTGVIVRNMARFVVRGFRQMDVKTSFLYGGVKEEIYVDQPSGWTK
ncbi:putative mitochondrial protein AtMg00820 [Bidens hawaiensis]|uniref:putative mitochondrial protein AtMg00820 n=1 Tax=Bidens hawaiensis TaxID=980011 RepID=UPI00404B3ACD